MRHWGNYTKCRNEIFLRTHTKHAPWHILRADDKHAARLDLIRHLLAHLRYHGKTRRLLEFDPAVIFEFEERRLPDGSLAR